MSYFGWHNSQISLSRNICTCVLKFKVASLNSESYYIISFQEELRVFFLVCTKLNVFGGGLMNKVALMNLKFGESILL